MSDTCYRTLKNKYIGYINITYLDIYNHLVEEYGGLWDDEMQESNELIKSEITGETHLEDFFNKLKTVSRM